MKKSNIVLTIVVIFIVVVVAGYFLYIKLTPQKVQAPSQPPVADFTAGWKTYTDALNGVQLKYPATFSGATWRAQTWPPLVSVIAGDKDSKQACGQNIFSPPNPVLQTNKTINSINFVVYEGSDVGAGQLYSDYCYVLSRNNKYYSINFLIHSTNGCGNGNCGPWCGTSNEQACKKFDMQKEVVQPIEKIVSTLKFTK